MLRSDESPIAAFLSARVASSASVLFDITQWQPIYDDILDVLQAQFGAYTLDLMWEQNQGTDTRLEPIAMKEHNDRLGIDERHGFDGLEAYGDNSIVGFCWKRNKPVWIIDNSEDGLDPQKGYQNLIGSRDGADDIPEKSFFNYNRATIKTEVCYPLRVGKRAAGVLNLEFLKPVFPNRRAINLLRRTADLVASIHARVLADQTLQTGDLRAIKEAKQEVTKHGPGVIPTAFVAYPMSDPPSRIVGEAVTKWLQDNDIKVNIPAERTNSRITDQIFDDLRTCHFGIVVSTGFNVNVIFEWGYLSGIGKDVIRLHSIQSGTEQDPFDIASTKRIDIPYSDAQLDDKKLGELLDDALAVFKTQKHRLSDLFME